MHTTSVCVLRVDASRRPFSNVRGLIPFSIESILKTGRYNGFYVLFEQRVIGCADFCIFAFQYRSERTRLSLSICVCTDHMYIVYNVFFLSVILIQIRYSSLVRVRCFMKDLMAYQLTRK